MDVYEHTRDFEREGCIIGARPVSYRILERGFVCIACGGKPVHHFARIDGVTQDWAECGHCKCRDFISQRRYDAQCVEYYEILEKLPPSLRALFPKAEPYQGTADDAIAELFDL